MRSKLTYANVVATLCLFALLGGGAYAALKLPKNSVKAKQIARNAVGESEIRAGAVGSDEVDDGSLGAEDIASGVLAGQKGEPGPPGAKGDKGDAGDTGATGQEGPPGPTAIVSRMGYVAFGPTSSPSGPGETTLPTSGNSWSQGATEMDEIFAQVVLTPPATPCNNSVVEFGLGTVDLKLDGVTIATVSLPAGGSQATVPLTAQPPAGGVPAVRPILFQPGPGGASRTLTATVADNCTNASTASVSDFKANVVGYG